MAKKNLKLNFLSFLHNTFLHVNFKVTEPATPLLGSGPGRGIFFPHLYFNCYQPLKLKDLK